MVRQAAGLGITDFAKEGDNGKDEELVDAGAVHHDCGLFREVKRFFLGPPFFYLRRSRQVIER